MSFQIRQGAVRFGQARRGAQSPTTVSHTQTKAASSRTTAKAGALQPDSSRNSITQLERTADRIRRFLPDSRVHVTSGKLSVVISTAKGDEVAVQAWVSSKRPELIRMSRVMPHSTRVLYVDTPDEAATLAHIWVKNYRSRA